MRNTALRTLYGINLDDYQAMLVAQAGKCAICGTATEKLKVDHNHTTGKVRGLLCHLCNAALGCARDDIAILVRAAAYLYAHERAGGAAVRAELILHANGGVVLARYGS